MASFESSKDISSDAGGAFVVLTGKGEDAIDGNRVLFVTASVVVEVVVVVEGNGG